MKRLLFIAHRMPYPPDKGERLRAFHEIKALANHFRVTVAALTHSPADVAAAEGLRPMCQDVIHAFGGRRAGLFGGGWARQHDRRCKEQRAQQHQVLSERLNRRTPPAPPRMR